MEDAHGTASLNAHRTALLDWLACAAGGRGEPAVLAARAAGGGVLETVAALGAAGHVLDFDDTYLPGLAHLSAPTAPAALGLGAALGATAGDVLSAHAAGFEAMAALARAGHPALYERGWHPTAVCGTVGAASAAAALLGLDEGRRESALALAALRAAGSRAGFGSDGKALSVGLAAAAGVACARLAAAGGRAPRQAGSGPAGYAAVTGGVWAEPEPGEPPAVLDNWLKPWPCCLMAHAPIEAALAVRGGAGAGGPDAADATRAGELIAGAQFMGLIVRVHPRARQAAPVDDPADGLQAKFSIPYLVAFTLLRGAPAVASFAGVDSEARALGAQVRVTEDAALGETEARLEAPGGEEMARVTDSLGSPARPMDPASLEAKARALGGDALPEILDDPELPAAALLAAIGWE